MLQATHPEHNSLPANNILVGRDENRSAPHAPHIAPLPPEDSEETSPSTFTCPVCHGARGWVDRYANPPHCFACVPIPSPSLVASLVGDWPADSHRRLKVGQKANREFSDSEKGGADRNHLDASGKAASPTHLAAAEAQGRTIATLDESGAVEARENAADAILARRIAYQIDFTERMDRRLGRPPTNVITITEPSPRA
jgi:hypothetical protein